MEVYKEYEDGAWIPWASKISELRDLSEDDEDFFLMTQGKITEKLVECAVNSDADAERIVEYLLSHKDEDGNLCDLSLTCLATVFVMTFCKGEGISSVMYRGRAEMLKGMLIKFMLKNDPKDVVRILGFVMKYMLAGARLRRKFVGSLLIDSTRSGIYGSILVALSEVTPIFAEDDFVQQIIGMITMEESKFGDNVDLNEDFEIIEWTIRATEEIMKLDPEEWGAYKEEKTEEKLRKVFMRPKSFITQYSMISAVYGVISERIQKQDWVSFSTIEFLHAYIHSCFADLGPARVFMLIGTVESVSNDVSVAMDKLRECLFSTDDEFDWCGTWEKERLLGNIEEMFDNIFSEITTEFNPLTRGYTKKKTEIEDIREIRILQLLDIEISEEELEDMLYTAYNTEDVGQRERMAFQIGEMIARVLHINAEIVVMAFSHFVSKFAGIGWEGAKAKEDIIAKMIGDFVEHIGAMGARVTSLALEGDAPAIISRYLAEQCSIDIATENFLITVVNIVCVLFDQEKVGTWPDGKEKNAIDKVLTSLGKMIISRCKFLESTD